MSDNPTTFTYNESHLSDVGCVRKVNEDSLFAAEDGDIWVVADGMGGHAAGDFASQTIVKHMASIGRPASAEDLIQRFTERLATANSEIMQRAAELDRGTIGSTLAALLAYEGRFICFWSGDSRVYRHRRHQLRRVSKDHTEVQALLDAGSITQQEAETWPRKNVITHAIGVSQTPIFDVIEGRIEDGDVFLICSDGLTDYFADSEIENVLNTKDVSLADQCVYFVQTALERGGKDNVTVILVRANEHDAPQSEAYGMFPEYGGLL